LLGLLAEQVLDGGIKQEVSGEIVDLSGYKLEQLLHDGVHDTYTVSADTVQHLIDSDSLYLLGLGGSLNEHLGVQVVVIVRHIVSSLSQ